MNMRKVVWVGVAAIALFEAGFAHADVIRLGIAGPLTGPIAHLGKDAESGAKLAVNELNRQKLVIGGAPVTFELVSEDDQGDPKDAVKVAQRLVDDGVKGVIGHLNSGPTIVASRIYANAGVPQVAPVATNPTLTTQGFRTTFRLMATDNQQGGKLAAFAKRIAGSGGIALVDDRSAYGQGLIDEVEKDLRALGVTPLAREYTNDKAVDFSGILTRIKAAQPAVIVYGGADAQAGPMVKRMIELGINAAFIGGDGVCTADWTKLSGGANERQYCTQAGAPHDRMPRYAEFKAKFERQFGKIVVFAPYSYDATMLIADAMRRANSVDPKVYVNALATSRYTGITGEISFSPTGDNINGTVAVYQIKNGNLVPVSNLN